MLTDIEALRQYITQNRIDIINFVPGLLKQLFDGWEKPRCLRVVLSGAQVLEEELKNDILRQGYRLFNQYGPTEATVDSLTQECRLDADVTIGRPISNMNAYILDRDRHPVPVGVVGELWVSGAGVARGYLNKPGLTAEKFAHDLWDYRDYRDKQKFLGVQGPFFKKVPGRRRLYQTGDLAKWLPGGEIQFVGRKDHLVKIRGFRIELEEIENLLVKHPAIKEAAASVKGEGDDKFLCAYIVTKKESNDEDLTGRLKEFLSRELPGYMIPSYFVMQEKMPLTASGKVDRKALPEPVITDENKYAAPRDKVEEKLVEIWAQVLGIDTPIGIDDNFFELGGHSLKATIVISRIHREFAVKVPLAEMFRNPSAGKLSEYIRGASPDSYPALEKAEEKEYYPLSAAQKRLYIIRQMEPGSTSYNMAHTFPAGKEIDEKRLEETFRKLIKRHDSLRTGFYLLADEPVQKVHEEVEFEIENYSLATEAVGDRSQNSFIRPFDLSGVPLLRVGLIEKSGSGYLLMIDMHHIISDGTSQKILEREFAVLYAGKELPPLKLQYKDYAEWQNSEAQQALIKEQEKYWLKEFNGELPVLNLPIDYPRPPVQGYEGRKLGFFIEEEITRRLNRICRKTGATIYMALLSAFNLLFSRLSGQQDIIIGAPMAGRRHADLQDIIGMFVNTLSLRNYPEAEKRFIDFLKEVKERTLEVYENQEYPFEELVDKLSVRRDTSRNPIFDVMFNFLNQAEYRGEIKDTDADIIIDLGDSKAIFDLIFQGTELKGVLHFTADYCTALYQPETIKRFITYFKRILTEITKDPTQRLFMIDLVSEEEKQRILVDFNDTARAYPENTTIHELFAEQAEKTPDHIAIVGGAHELRELHEKEKFQIPNYKPPIQPDELDTDTAAITYRELNRKADQLAHLLREKGVLPDIIVGIMVKRSIEMIIGILGILKAGGCYLPIDPQSPGERIDYMLKDSNAKILLSWEYFSLQESPLERGGRRPGCVSPSNLAYVIYTSGSTGKPKGVMIRHRNVVNFIHGIVSRINFSAGKTILALTTISFDIFVLETLLPLLNGLKIIIASEEEQKDPGLLAKAIVKNSVNMLQVTPSSLKLLVNHDAHAGLDCLGNIEELIVGGESFPKDLFEILKIKYSGRIYNMYGPTETTVWSTVKELSGEDEITIGIPIANTQIYIIDPYKNPQPVGVVGELCIGGHGLARGYLNNPGLTAEKFDQDYRDENYKKTFKQKFFGGSRGAIFQKSPPGLLYKTGDLARWLPDGNIEFLGRMDFQVKIRGFRIELGEIENRLMRHQFVKEAVVIAREDENGDGYLCAYFAAHPGSIGGLEGELREYLSRVLPGYMVPAVFVCLEKIPLTSSGKIDRGALPQPGIRGAGEYEAPRSQVEEQLARIYRELLKVEKVGIRDNFFALGGNSLKAVKLVSRVHETLHTDLPVMQVFQTPAIRELAHVLLKSRMIESKDTVVTLLNLPKPAKIFAFPPAVGFGISYSELAGLLQEHSFYAFDYIESDEEKEKEESMNVYLDALREIQPQGPYVLLGYSAGGKLCIKAAELLEKAGHVVSDIIILDTYSRVGTQDEQEKEKEVEKFYRDIESGIEYLGLRRMKQRIMGTVKNYLHYYNRLELRGKVNSVVHLIQAEDKRGKKGFVGWGDFTCSREIVYQGHGAHAEMLAPGFIEKNVRIIEKILAGIQGQARMAQT